MTTAGHFRDTVTGPATVSIAGVPWPTYKLLSLLLGFLVFGVVAALTTAAAPAVLAGAGAGAFAWIALGLLNR